LFYGLLLKNQCSKTHQNIIIKLIYMERTGTLILETICNLSLGFRTRHRFIRTSSIGEERGKKSLEFKTSALSCFLSGASLLVSCWISYNSTSRSWRILVVSLLPQLIRASAVASIASEILLKIRNRKKSKRMKRVK